MASLNDFLFVGSVPASKSLLNRALIVQSYFPYFKVIGDSQADDVQKMRQALMSLRQGQPIDCGHAGTVLRFATARAARDPGRYEFFGSQRLMGRLPQELIKLLLQLGQQVETKDARLYLRSWGWKPMGDGLYVPADHSSQFASALLLNSWNLPQPLHFSVPRSMVSQGYWRMTLQFVRALGMEVENWQNDYRIPPQQKVKEESYTVEPDLSSAFALAAVAAVSGQARFSDFPEKSLQPDAVFPEILQKMGVPVSREDQQLVVRKAESLKPIHWDVSEGPDVFPVLVALCALAEGESRIVGGSQLAVKESHRLKKMAELLARLSVPHEVLPDGLIIRGPVNDFTSFVEYDSDQDHRLVMAAAVLKKAGCNITVSEPEVVNKSFPEFLSTVRAWP